MKPKIIHTSRKSAIWIVSLLTAIAFIALFVLQTRYFQEVYNMSKGQFDASVKHSLYQAARKMELDETQIKLEKIILSAHDSTDTHSDIDQIKELAPSLELAGVVVTKVDARKNYFKQTMETLRSTEGIRVYENVIHLDSSVEWAQDNSKPVGSYKKSSRSASEYGLLAEEILKSFG